jgi:hypothetical protein
VSDRDAWADPPMLVLASLAQEPRHGYAITQDVEATMGVRLSAGTLYAVIARLESRGLIEPLPADDDVPTASPPKERACSPTPLPGCRRWQAWRPAGCGSPGWGPPEQQNAARIRPDARQCGSQRSRSGPSRSLSSRCSSASPGWWRGPQMSAGRCSCHVRCRAGRPIPSRRALAERHGHRADKALVQCVRMTVGERQPHRARRPVSPPGEWHHD